MKYKRDSRGVLVRTDGKGDGWALAHRQELGNKFLMSDFDVMFSAMVAGHNTGDRLFWEYAPDDYSNRSRLVRQFALVALFDRKRTLEAAVDPRNTIATATYLWHCRIHAYQQPASPRFFYVVGLDAGPWLMYELNIWTGEAVGEPHPVRPGAWRSLWDGLGLTSLREELTRFLADV